jgi:hypothetical protein
MFVKDGFHLNSRYFIRFNIPSFDYVVTYPLYNNKDKKNYICPFVMDIQNKRKSSKDYFKICVEFF